MDLKGYRVLTICKGNPEILVGKSNVLHPSFWRTSESMGCDLRGGNFRTLFSLFCCFGYFIHCGGSFSQHVKFYSFIFMHKISSRVICVNGKHPLVYWLVLNRFLADKWEIMIPFPCTGTSKIPVLVSVYTDRLSLTPEKQLGSQVEQ